MGWINFLQGVHYRLSLYFHQRRREPNVGIEPTMFVMIAILVYFPSLALFLPGLIMG